VVDPYPGQHQEKRGQQVERGDSAPLLYSGETQPGVLHSALEPSAQGRHRAVGAGPETQRQSKRWSTSAMRKDERVGPVQPGEGGKTAGRPSNSLPVPEGGL